MKKILLLVFALFSLSVSVATPHYWVGGTGSWNNPSNWSLSSGGPGGASIPTASDDVIFDQNSFSAAKQTVKVTTNAVCRNMDWTSIDDNVIFSAAKTKKLTVHGSYSLSPMLMNGFKGQTVFASSNFGNTIRTEGRIIIGDWVFQGNGSWTLQDNVTTEASVSISLLQGSLVTNGKNIDCGYFIGNSNLNRSLDLSSSQIIVRNLWDFSSSSNITFNAGSSTIFLKDIIDNSTFRAGTLTYNDVELLVTFCSPSGTPCVPNFVITLDMNSITCNSFCDGTAWVVSVTGGTGPYGYDWQGPATPAGDGTDSIFNLCAGNYTVRVTDSASMLFCFCNINVPEPSVLFDYELFTIQPSCNGICDGISAVDATGGTPPYTYVWMPGGFTNDTVSGLCDDTYTITVTDSNNCTGFTTIVVTEPTPLVSPGSSTDVTCFGFCNGTASVTASGGSPPYTYDWTPGSPTGDTTPNITNLCPGSYTVTVTDTNFCTSTYIATIIEPPILTLTMSQTNASCGGICDGTATATITGGTPPYTYAWSTGSSTLTGALTNTISALCDGTYSVTVTDANGCNITDSVTITEPPILVATATGTNVTCFNACDGTATAGVVGGSGGYTYDWSGSPAGDFTPTITALCPATYTVTVTDINGCADTGVVTITEPPLLVANFSSTDVLCFGACNGTATALPTGGTTPPGYFFDWLPGAPTGEGTPTITGLCPGTYSVIVTDGNGCIDTSASIVIIEPPVLDAAVTFTNVTCNGACDGTATANPTGGTASYTFVWSTGAITPGITALCPGTYTVTVTDANGCTDTMSVIIIQPNSLSVTIATTTLLCNGDCDAIATATVTGGTPGFTFNWSPGSPTGDTTSVISNLCADTWSVMVVDANGCPATASATITEPTPLFLATGTTDVTCFGLCNGSASTVVGGGSGGYMYDWSPGGQITPSITMQCAGSYTIDVTDINGCVISDTVTINEPNQLLANPAADNMVTCSGLCNGSATATPTGGTGAYTYNWAPGTPTGDGTPTITNLCAGTYTVTVTDATGCTSVQTVVITQPPILSAPITNSTSSCNICNGTATVTPAGGTPPYDYLWSDGQITQTAVGLCPNQTFTVTVTDLNGCQASNTVTILQTIVITITTSNTTLSCFGACDGIATANPAGGTAPYSFIWDGPTACGPMPFFGPTLTTAGAGTYTVTVADSNGCFNIDSVTFTDPPQLVVTSTTTNVTCGGGCDGTATANPVGGTGTYTYSWNTVPVQTTQTAINLCVGNYIVTVTDSSGCTDTSQVVIIEPPPIVDNVTITPANCSFSDGVISVAPTGGNGIYAYDWTPGSPVGEGTATITNLSPGVYGVIITSGGCSSTFNYLLGNTTGPSLVMASTDITCTGDCDGSASVVASGGAGGYVYDWQGLASPVGDGTDSITALCGTITYTVQVTDAAGCINLDTITLFNPLPVDPNPFVTNESCGGFCDGSIALSTTGGTGAYIYAWSTGASSSSISSLCAGSYTVTVTDANGCDTVLVLTITSPPLLMVALDSVNVLCNSACNGTATAIPAGGAGGYSYAWSHGAFILPNVVNLCPGSYTVTVTDANGCTATDVVNITEPVALTSFTSQTNASCNGICDGVAIVTANGGTMPYSYIWNPVGILNDTASGLCDGPYNATVTDANGCVSNPPGITITEPAPIVPNASSIDPTCFNSCNGSATALPSGGTAPYTYLWSGGAGATQTVNSLCAGPYSLTVTDSLGCTGTDNVTLTDPPALNANTSSTSPTCSGDCDGTVTATPTGGTGPGTYTFSWTPPGSALQTVVGLCAGSYQVIVTDGNACADTAFATVVDPLPIDILIGSTPASCGFCDGTISITPITGTPGYSYVWTIGGVPPGAPFTGNGTPNVTNVCAGLYQVLVTDSNGCDSIFTIPMNNSGGPTGEVVSVVDATCFGVCDGIGSIDSVIGGVAPYNFLWNDTTGTTNDTAINLCAGNYFVQVTDANGCIWFSPVTIGQPAPIIANGVPTSAFCSTVCNGSITVTPTGGTGGYTYDWAPGAPVGDGTPTVTSLCPGTYTVTITDANGCTQTDSFAVTQSSPVVATITGTNISCSSICSGMAYVTITSGVPPFTFQWNDGFGQTNDTATSLCAGTYTVDILDGNGCTTSQTITITATPAVAGNPVVTPAGCGVCDGQATLTPTGGTPGYTYFWSNGDTTATADSLCAGLYTVNITDSSGCVSSVSVPVSNTGGPTSVNFTTTNASCFGICDGAVLTATPVGGTAPYSFNWIPSGIAIPGISGLCAGVYYLQVTDVNGCSVTDSVTITEPPQILANQIITSPACGVCDGVITIAPSCAGSTVLWNTGSSALSINSLCAGVYSVMITCPSGCSQNVIIPLSNTTSATLTTSGDTVTCNADCDGTVGVVATGGTSPYTYVWNDVGSTPTDSVTNLCVGTYFVQVTGADGCIAIASATIAEPPAIGFSVANSVNPLCNGNANGSITTIPSGGTLPYTYVWSPAPAAGQTTETATGLDANTYTVIVTDANGCTAQQVVTLINPVSLGISNVATNPSCTNTFDGTIDVTVTGGTLPYIYTWSGCSTATTEDLSGLIECSSYIITVRDSNLCTIADTIDLIANVNINANAGNDTSFCESGSITMNASGSTGAATYEWYDIPGNTLLGSAVTLTITPTSGTSSYYVVIDNGGGCTDNDTITITSNPLPGASAGIDEIIVIGASTGIGGSPTTSSAGATTTWSPVTGLDNSTLANPTANPVTTTTYVVTVTSVLGCVSIDSMVVTVLPTIFIPNGISPNGDGDNDEWIIDGIELFPNCNVEVYNRWGELLFQSPGYKEKWNGTFKGKELPIGTYYYIIDLGDPLFPDDYTGPITIMR